MYVLRRPILPGAGAEPAAAAQELLPHRGPVHRHRDLPRRLQEKSRGYFPIVHFLLTIIFYRGEICLSVGPGGRTSGLCLTHPVRTWNTY